jgi:hypothetical protein
MKRNRPFGNLLRLLRPLETEEKELRTEMREITASSEKLKDLLAAKVRVARHEGDVLLLEGRTEEAAAKYGEMRAAEDAPRLMLDRQIEIAERLDAIRLEKRETAMAFFDRMERE